MIIVAADTSDLKRILEIYKQYYEKDAEYFTELVEQSIKGTATDPTELYMVSKDDENNVQGILGYRNAIKKFLLYTSTPKPLEIYALFVDTNHLGQGIGSSLIEYVKEYTKQNSYSELIVRSSEKFKDTSWEFYTKMEFEEVGIITKENGRKAKMFRFVL